LQQSDPIVERAVALAGSAAADGDAVGELVRLAGDEPEPLHRAQGLLVRRIRQRSDDYAATGALTLVNAAIRHLGWQGDFTWLPRGQK
jgi:hypothetical protein